uniref:C2H2-type domain-containing protein n=1 Tax=Oryzias latipes TaxID=8090 RepID=H2L4E6_ORYLA
MDDGKGPEPTQIKEDKEELCISQDEEQLELKQETDTLMEIPTYEEKENSERIPRDCKECGKSFGYFSQLKFHMRFHTKGKPFACMKCTQSFSKLTNLKSHMRTHTGEKPFSCKECGRSNSRINGLTPINHSRYEDVQL